MDIQEFIERFKHTFVYELLSETLTDEQLFEHVIDKDGAVIWFKDQTRQMWFMWQAAKAQAVPEAKAVIDVIAERKRQIEKEHYAIEHDDEYQNNELLRAAVCYADNVAFHRWVFFDSSFGPDVYQSEEVPDEWPWGHSFWKPKDPRKDLVRAAALLLAEIERIDRIEAQEQGHD